jgi:DNA helicase-2/ATP-dependent DNA helicase PcrA
MAQEEGSLLDDMNNFLNGVNKEQDEARGVHVIRPNNSNNNANLEKFYAKLTELGINLDELGGILECQDNLLVLSGAGSGKTTALILKIIRDLISGDMMKFKTVNSIYGQSQVMVPANILISTFLKTGAEELKASFFEWCRILGIVGIDTTTIHFRTIHAEVKDCLKQMGVHTEVLEDGDKLIRAIMNKYGIRATTATSRSLTIDELSDMASLVAYARNRLDEKRYEHQLMQDYRLDTILFDAVLRDLKLQRAATGKVDFEDMQEMLLEAAQLNPNVRDFISKRYDYVYVDEFQDTSQLQYELLKYYFAGCKRVITIGDDDQTIYSWRGSDAEIIAHRFEEDIKPTVLMLSVNYRCAANILNMVIPSIELNSNRHPKQLRAHKEGGEINLVLGGDVNSLVASMMKDLSSGHKVGVLARVNADLLIPAIILELDGGVEFGLSKSVNMNSRMARQVFGIMDLVTKRNTEEFEGYFKCFVPKYNWFEASKLYNVLLANKTMNLYNIPLADLQHSVPTLFPFIKGLRDAKEVGEVEAYLFILGMLEKQAFVGKSLYAQKARDLVIFTRKIILEHKDVRNLSLGQIDNLFNSVLPERMSRRIKYGRDVFVKLTTVHEAKGKEWDSVYIWNDVEGSFPNVVGSRELTVAEFEEERRVHYIACTRAKVKLTIYSDELRMGAFLKECDLSLANVEQTTAMVSADMTRVFKKNSGGVGVASKTDTVLRGYISNVNENGGITDERVANIEIVLNAWQFEDLVERIESQYGLHLTPEYASDVLDLFFSTLADELFNKGNV